MSIFHKSMIFLIWLWLIQNECLGGQTLKPPKQPRRADRALWLKILKWPQQYEADFQKSYPQSDYSGLHFYQLGKDRYLVQIMCYSGAYQPGQLFMIYEPQATPASSLLHLEGFGAGKDQDLVIDGQAHFNDKAKTLEIFSKYRGPGDCGRWIRYSFVKAKPMVLEAHEKDCAETKIENPTNPRKWPKIKL